MSTSAPIVVLVVWKGGIAVEKGAHAVGRAVAPVDKPALQMENAGLLRKFLRDAHIRTHFELLTQVGSGVGMW